MIGRNFALVNYFCIWLYVCPRSIIWDIHRKSSSIISDNKRNTTPTDYFIVQRISSRIAEVPLHSLVRHINELLSYCTKSEDHRQ
jgi:hypothetical protein